MQLKALSCLNFRNYADLRFAPDAPVVCLTGPNGAGKTNLLDAIYYLCIGKSYFNPVDQLNIRHGATFLRLEGSLLTDDGTSHDATIVYEQGKRKQLTVNGVPEPKLADHFGRFPVVVIAPDDVVLVNGGSEERRRFMDFVLSFTDRDYFNHLLTYTRVLQQRNQYLRQASERGKFDQKLLATYNSQLEGPTAQMFDGRKAFLAEFLPVFREAYRTLCSGSEDVEIRYQSALEHKPMAELLAASQEKDRALQRTTAGPHRDDLLFTLGSEELKKFGSQGQKKSFLISLKLAQYRFLEQHTGMKPLLLLDDLFDKLDSNRAAQMLKLVGEGQFGQVFISDTGKARLEELPFLAHDG